MHAFECPTISYILRQVLIVFWRHFLVWICRVDHSTCGHAHSSTPMFPVAGQPGVWPRHVEKDEPSCRIVGSTYTTLSCKLPRHAHTGRSTGEASASLPAIRTASSSQNLSPHRAQHGILFPERTPSQAIRAQIPDAIAARRIHLDS